MRLLFCYTLQGQKMVNLCINNVKQSRIPYKQCRFFYCDEETRQYLVMQGLKDQYIVQSSGLGLELDGPLNAMRISKNKPDYLIIGLDFNTKITKYANLIEELGLFSQSLSNRLCMFTSKFMYPCRRHLQNSIDSRVLFCNNIHKQLLTNYIDTCQSLDSNALLDVIDYSDSTVLENMSMNQQISIDFSGLRNQTLFQQFFLSHFSDY